MVGSHHLDEANRCVAANPPHGLCGLHHGHPDDPGPAGFDSGHSPAAQALAVGAPGTGGVRLAQIQSGNAADADTPGFCYLRLVRLDARSRMRRDLGVNPFLSEVVAWLQRNVSEHSSAKFKIAFGVDPIDMHNVPAFVQAHVSECRLGMRVKQVLNHPALDVRLGAERQSPSHNEAGGSGSSVRAIQVAAAKTRVRIPFAATLKHSDGAISFSPRTSSTVGSLVKYFESAELVELSVSANIGGGAGALLAVGLSVSARAPASTDAFLDLPYCAMFSGTDHALGVGDFALPPDHGFGREVKAVAVGNPDPVLHMSLDSGTASFAQIRGVLVLDVAGCGVPSPVRLAPAK